MTDSFDPQNPLHQRIEAGIERESGIVNIDHYQTIYDALPAVGFEVLEARDLNHEPGPSILWYQPLTGSALPFAGFRSSRFGRFVTHNSLKVLEALRIAPKGTVHVSGTLNLCAAALVEAGRLGIFTPVYFIHARKPALHNPISRTRMLPCEKGLCAYHHAEPWERQAGSPAPDGGATGGESEDGGAGPAPGTIYGQGAPRRSASHGQPGRPRMRQEDAPEPYGGRVPHAGTTQTFTTTRLLCVVRTYERTVVSTLSEEAGLNFPDPQGRERTSHRPARRPHQTASRKSRLLNSANPKRSQGFPVSSLYCLS